MNKQQIRAEAQMDQVWAMLRCSREPLEIMSRLLELAFENGMDVRIKHSCLPTLGKAVDGVLAELCHREKHGC